jgi:hypothetical protein
MGAWLAGRSLAVARSRSSASVSGPGKGSSRGASAPPWQSYYSTDANDLYALSVVLRRPIRRMEIALSSAYSPERGRASRAGGAWDVRLSQRLRLPMMPSRGGGSSGDLAAGSTVGVLRVGRDPASVPTLTQRPPPGAIAVVALLVGVDRGAKVEFGSAGLG